MKKLLFVLVITGLGLLIGCGGSSTPASSGGNHATLQSITIGPGSPTINLAAPGATPFTQQFTATAHFSDGTSHDITSSAAWTSSAPGVATINNSGLATSVGVGSTTISASSGSINSGTGLKVVAQLLSIAVLPGTPSIPLGLNQQFAATAHFSDSTSQNVTSQVIWSSSAAGVAAINAAGLASTGSVGNATITAALGSVSGSANLAVTNATLVSLDVTPLSSSIPLGTLQQFVATGTFTDHSNHDMTGSVLWSSSQAAIANIVSSGLATANGLGTATITAKAGAILGSTDVTVNTANVVSVEIQPTNTTIANATNVQYAAIATFNDGSTLNVSVTSGINWSSSTPGIATIGSHSGLAVANGAGSSVIGVTFGTLNSSTTLNVSSATIQSISVSPASPAIAPGTTEKFSATGTFSDGSTQNITSVATWSSDNTGIATVSNGPTSFGLATAVAQGVANVKASFTTPGGPTSNASSALSVSNATLDSITITPASAVMAPAGLVQYSATGNFSDGSTQVLTLQAAWSSSQTGVATVNATGLVTGITSGTTNIKASLSGVNSLPSGLSVTASPLVSIAVSCISPQIAHNTSEKCSATGSYADGSTQNLSAVTHWTSSQTGVATISNTQGLRGQATGVSAGNSTITALLGGIVGSANLAVSNANLVSIDLSPSSATISLGQNQEFTASGNFDDGTTQNLSSEPLLLLQLGGDEKGFIFDAIFPEWDSVSLDTAVVSAAGIATSTGTGTTVVRATLNGVTGTANLTVN